MSVHAAGTEPGQRRLNGPQTTGREYRDLSEAQYGMTRDEDAAVTTRDGTRLMADVFRPDDDGRFPALIAASPYPRQIQDLGAPMGFIEAGASDFWVPRGYVHVIVNLRGTGGSEGTFGLFDETERQDLYDVVEWAAVQDWCDGNVGMVGISYFAMSQLEAAVGRPPHLKAIFPLAVTPDLYEAAYHNGLFSAGFISPFIAGVGMLAQHGDRLWRGPFLDAARHVLAIPRVHARLGQMNGEASVAALTMIRRTHHAPHPWDDLWQDMAVDHQLRDAFWDERNVLPALGRVEVPVHLGCDWENVPLHLPGTFTSWEALEGGPPVRMALLGPLGLTWPWESLHVEALAWFDHWLKDRDTGIMDGPPIRYWLPGAEEWRTLESWPPAAAAHRELALRADGALAEDEGEAGLRELLCLTESVHRPPANAPALPAELSWETEILPADLDVVGEIELRLTATSSAPDTAWIALLVDVAPDGSTTEVTAGWLRASLRAVDEAASRPGRPVLPCRVPEAVPVGEPVEYRIPLVPNARRFAEGHRIRLILLSDDQPKDAPAIMGFRHAPAGSAARNGIHSTSRLLLPVLPAAHGAA